MMDLFAWIETVPAGWKVLFGYVVGTVAMRWFIRRDERALLHSVSELRRSTTRLLGIAEGAGQVRLQRDERGEITAVDFGGRRP